MESTRMKVLDLFCGMGGWSIPFIEDGHEVWGIDVIDYGYPGKLVKEDIHQLDGYGFQDMDLIIGSPPCTEFSIAKEFGKYGKGQKRNIEKGFNLIADFYRFVQEAQPKFWAMENVSNLEQWWTEPPIWRFRISRGGRRSLWGNIPIGLSPEYRFQRAFGISREARRKYKELGQTDIRDPKHRAMIPYPIARFVANAVASAYKPEAK
jgi:hypothetical protein